MDITITAYDPQGDDSWLDVTVDDIVQTEYTVHYDHDKQSRSEILLDGEEVALSDADRAAILDRIELFLTFYDDMALKAKKIELTEQAVAAMEEHLDKVAADALLLHQAVKITTAGWLTQHDARTNDVTARGVWRHRHGIITSTDNAARGIYEVTYWAGNSGAPLVHDFHYRDLAPLS